MRDFAGKTAFITCGGSGIGLGMARAFLARGMNVVLADLLQNHLDEAEAELGHTNRAPCVKLTFLPGMKAHGEGGHVVNTSSMAGMIPVPSFAGIYATTKFAVRGMTDSLRLARTPYNIGASVSCPGLTQNRAMTAGDLYRKAHRGEAVEGEKRDPITGGTGIGEIGEYVAQAIEENRPYIFPHGEFHDEVTSFFKEMLDTFPKEFEIVEQRRAAEDRRAKMTAKAKALADALGSAA